VWSLQSTSHNGVWLAAPADSGTNGARVRPESLRRVAHTSITGFEPCLGPDFAHQPVAARHHERQSPACRRYKNPILKPEAAEIVKKHARCRGRYRISDAAQPVLAGGVPFVFTTTGIEILQQPARSLSSITKP